MATIPHTSDDRALDLLTEPVLGDCRLAGLLLSFVLAGLVLSTFIDLSGVDTRRHQPTRQENVRVIRATGRLVARRKAA